METEHTEIAQDIWSSDEAHFWAVEMWITQMHVTGVAKNLIFTFINLYIVKK